MKWCLRLVWGAFFLLTISAGTAQQVCPNPPALERPAGKNIFSDQQEVDLGDAAADSLARFLLPTDEPTLTAHLDELGQRLLRFLPSNQLRFRFYLVDVPEVNAFSLPGGRIYVSRKLIGLTRSDDELAGVLAHEMGHIVTHQAAVVATWQFRVVLGVTEVGDRADIYEKVHRLLDHDRRMQSLERSGAESEEYVADQIALYAMARAGFAPQSLVEWWERVAASNASVGNAVSDLFGHTRPEQRRLRELLKAVAAMPTECTQVSPSSTTQFEVWHAQVISASNSMHAESLPGLLVRQKLSQPLQPAITNLRYSPDGRYLLAQDEGGIHVLMRDPFEALFFVEAPDADKAFFSPNSRSVIFKSRSLRAEVWDVASRSRTLVQEIGLRVGCMQSLLSPDGKYLACLNTENALQLIEVESGKEIVSRKHFYEGDSDGAWNLSAMLGARDSNLTLIRLTFSPDGRYLLAGTSRKEFAYDLIGRREAKVPSSVRNLMREEFAFVDNTRIVGLNPFDPAKSVVLAFPGGKRLQVVKLTYGLKLGTTQQGKHIVVGPLENGKRGFMNLSTGKLNGVCKEDACDIYDSAVACEELDGRIALIDVPSGKILASAQLTRSYLGDTSAFSVSDDFNWLAASTRVRGALWDIPHNARVQLVRAFRDAWFAENGSLYGDFPQAEKRERSVVEVDAQGNASTVFSIGSLLANQEGPDLLVRTPSRGNPKQTKNWTYQLMDFRQQRALWTRQFPQEPPSFFVTPDRHAVLLGWPVASAAAHAELKQFADLKGGAHKEDILYELVDVTTGSVLNKLIVKTNKNSFQSQHAQVDGDWLLVEASREGIVRALTYSMKSGKEVGSVFGSAPVVSSAGGVYAVSANEAEVRVYRLADSRLLGTYTFPVSVAYKKISADGKRLFVLTRDQTAYVVGLSAGKEQPASAEKATPQ